MLVLSENANESIYVKREVERAVSKGKPVFPIRVREVMPSKSLELFISSAHWIDAWKPPMEKYLERLAQSISAAAALYPAGVPVSASSPAERSPILVCGKAEAPSCRRSPPVSSFCSSPALAGMPTDCSAVPGRPDHPRIWRRPKERACPNLQEPRRLRQRRSRSPRRRDRPRRSCDKPRCPRPLHRHPRPMRREPCPSSLRINRDLPTPFTCTCSGEAARSSSGAVWGTDVYTDSSDLCRAALHAGAIGADGGPITVARSEGRPIYAGSSRNGVTSNDYGS